MTRAQAVATITTMTRAQAVVLAAVLPTARAMCLWLCRLIQIWLMNPIMRRIIPV